MDGILDTIISNFRESLSKNLTDRILGFANKDNHKTNSVQMDFELLQKTKASRIGFKDNKSNHSRHLFGSNSKSVNNVKLKIYYNNNDKKNNLLEMIENIFAFCLVLFIYLMFVFKASFSCIFRLFFSL